MSAEPSVQASSVLLGSPASGMTRTHTTEADALPPLQRPTLLSTAHLLRKMETLGMVRARTHACVAVGQGWGWGGCRSAIAQMRLHVCA